MIICKKGIDNVKKNFIIYLYKKHKQTPKYNVKSC